MLAFFGPWQPSQHPSHKTQGLGWFVTTRRNNYSSRGHIKLHVSIKIQFGNAFMNVKFKARHYNFFLSLLGCCLCMCVLEWDWCGTNNHLEPSFLGLKFLFSHLAANHHTYQMLYAPWKPHPYREKRIPSQNINQEFLRVLLCSLIALFFAEDLWLGQEGNSVRFSPLQILWMPSRRSNERLFDYIRDRPQILEGPVGSDDLACWDLDAAWEHTATASTSCYRAVWLYW